MTIRLLAAAQAELDEAITWYNAQAPGLGSAFLVESVKVFRLIEQHPDAWHPMTAVIRRCRFARFPYGVIYTSFWAFWSLRWRICIANLCIGANVWRRRNRHRLS